MQSTFKRLLILTLVVLLAYLFVGFVASQFYDGSGEVVSEGAVRPPEP